MLLKRLWRRAAAILMVCLFGTNVSYVAAQIHTPGKSQIGGWVYIDKNNDGQINFANHANPEWMIGGVTVSLYAQSNLNTPLMSMPTDERGRFFFNDLLPGTYALRQSQPVHYVDGIDTVGQMIALNSAGQAALAQASVGVSDHNNEFNNIQLPANVRADYFVFGERGFALGYASKRFLEGYAPVLEFGTDEPGVLVPEPTTVWLGAMALGFMLTNHRRRRI